MRTKKRKILWMMFFAFVFCAAFQSHCIKAEAKVVKRDVTPREPSSSDLQVVRKVKSSHQKGGSSRLQWILNIIITYR